jgi:excisionase family DNA binding protein
MSDTSEWVSLRRAAEILGVHPATVRNWADRGDLVSRRTPGGHRRFRRADLVQYAQSHEELQPLELQVIIQNALGHARIEIGEGALADTPWYAAMSDDTRSTMRKEGRRILEALRAYLAAGAPDEQLALAIQLGKEYAYILTQDGLTLPQAMRGFFFFSEFVVDSILTWSEVSTPSSASEWSNLVRQVNNFMNAMLLSLVEYYEED